MWQITWIFGFLPEWIWTLLMLLGIIGVFVSWFLKQTPLKVKYGIPLQALSIIALLVGVYFRGAVANEEKWQVRIKELEEKVLKAEAEAEEANKKIKINIVERVKVVKQKGEKQIEYIDRVIKEKEEIKVFIEHCPIPSVIIEEHNKAAVRGDKK